MKFVAILSLALLTACAGHPHQDSPFQVQMVNIADSQATRHIKINRQTGETWWSANVAWKKIIDDHAIPESIYAVEMVATKGSWRLLRIDQVSGKTWKHSRGKWIPFSEKKL